REVSAMVMVGRPSPTNPFTVPATKNTASASRMCSVVISPSEPPRGNRGDQCDDGDDFGEAQSRPIATRLGRAGDGIAFGRAPLAFGDQVQAVDQAWQAAQA